MGKLHRARRLALQGLCCLNAQGERALAMVESFLLDSDEKDDTIAAARGMLRETFDNIQQCDKLLARHARHWELDRLAMVDRNVLRLAVYELLQHETPTKVVITEAMRLAEEFSTAESSRFVNGVLDAIAREIAAESAG